MSNIDKYTKFMSEQAKSTSTGLFGTHKTGFVTEADNKNETIENHLEKANSMEYNGRDYSSKHEFTSPHDHKTIVKMYRDHIKKSNPDTHSRLTAPETYSDGDSHDTDFNSHSSNLETRGLNVVHNIETTKTKDGYKHTISQRENTDR